MHTQTHTARVYRHVGRSVDWAPGFVFVAGTLLLTRIPSYSAIYLIVIKNYSAFCTVTCLVIGYHKVSASLTHFIAPSSAPQIRVVVTYMYITSHGHLLATDVPPATCLPSCAAWWLDKETPHA